MNTLFNCVQFLGNVAVLAGMLTGLFFLVTLSCLAAATLGGKNEVQTGSDVHGVQTDSDRADGLRGR